MTSQTTDQGAAIRILAYNPTNNDFEPATLSNGALLVANSGTTSSNVVVMSGTLTTISNVVSINLAATTITDESANAAAVPISGYTLLATLAANTLRCECECQNQDTSYVQLVLDDGLGTAGRISTIMLAPAAATGQQGGSWVSQSFKGRLRVYGPSGSQRVMLRGA